MIYELIGKVLREAGKESGMIFAASSVILVYLSLREKVLNMPRALELILSKEDGWLLVGEERDFV